MTHEIDAEFAQVLRSRLLAYPAGVAAISHIGERRAVEAAFGLPPVGCTATTSFTKVHVEIPGLLRHATLYHPVTHGESTPVIFYLHGGGMITGDPDFADAAAEWFASQLGAAVLAPAYRRAPEHRYPAQLDDCCLALEWLERNAVALGLDMTRLALYGASAGGNLALATAMRVRDFGGPSISLVMAPYPMVDHRNILPSTHEVLDVGVWDRAANLQAWNWYLGAKEPDDYAAPLHAATLSGLPPVFVDVGTVDLFRDEVMALAQRLCQEGVATELHMYPGAFHAAEWFAPSSARAEQMWENRKSALRRALHRGREGSTR